MADIAKTNQLEQSLSLGSLADLVRAKTSEQKYLLLDASASMLDHVIDKTGQVTRLCDQLRRVVVDIQHQHAVPMIAFGLLGYRGGENRTEPVYVDFVNEVPDPNPDSGTPLAAAIEFARQHGGGHLIVISDGMPNYPPSASLDAAAAFGGRIDVVFVGMPGSPGSDFLKELAEKTGGVQFEGDLRDVKALTGNVMGLLSGQMPEVVDEEDDEEDEDDEDEDEDEE